MRLRVMIATLLLGALGGFVFQLLAMPLAWMMGAMVVCAVAALAGVPLEGPGSARTVMITVLGVMVGTAFSPHIVHELAHWTFSIAVLIGYVVVVTTLIALAMRRVWHHDLPTAFFSATPGGLTEMLILGETKHADMRVVALTHSTRILLTVLLIPLWMRWFGGYVPPPGLPAFDPVEFELGSLAVLTGCAVLGFFLGHLLHLPTPQFLGPALLSAIAHVTGLTDAVPPAILIVIAQIVMGTAVGCRFVGYSLGAVRSVLLAAVLSTLFTVGMATLFALMLYERIGLSFETLWLAFAPGGLTEMILVSLAMDVDADFVSLHHVSRVLFIVAAASVAFGWLERRSRAPAPPSE